jgi:hypothetical protein
MAWLRIESNFASHRKVLAAGQQLGKGAVARVIGIWTIGACYAVAHLTDGLVPRLILEDTRYDKKPTEVIDALVAAGLLRAEGDGYRLHDFNEYNPSAADVKEKRRTDLARKRQFQKDSARNPNGIRADSETFPDGRFPPDPAAAAAFPEVPNPNPNPIPIPRSKKKEQRAAARAPVWTHGRPGAPLIGNHAGCFHAPAACERGLCVPLKLGLQWRQQRVPEAAIRAFVESTIARLPTGPIGDDPFTFWRAAWSAQHGSRAPKRASLPGDRPRAADVTLATLRRGSS